MVYSNNNRNSLGREVNIIWLTLLDARHPTNVQITELVKIRFKVLAALVILFISNRTTQYIDKVGNLSNHNGRAEWWNGHWAGGQSPQMLRREFNTRRVAKYLLFVHGTLRANSNNKYILRGCGKIVKYSTKIYTLSNLEGQFQC